METFSALLAICAGNSPVSGEFPAQRPVTRSFYVFFDLRPNKRLNKQLWGWWFETHSPPLWRHSNDKITLNLNILCGDHMKLKACGVTNKAIDQKFYDPLRRKLLSTHECVESHLIIHTR